MDGEKQTSKPLQNTWQGAPRQTDTTEKAKRCKIVVVGIGESGNNTITQLKKTDVTDVYTVGINTDAVQLRHTQADKKILIDKKLTSSKSAELNIVSGKTSQKETRKQIEEIFENVDVTFITMELGDGSSRGTAGIVAEIANKKSRTTIGVVIRPLRTEYQRARQTSSVLKKLLQKCSTVLVIDKVKLMELSSQLPSGEALNIAAHIVANVIRRIIDSASSPDFAGSDFASFKNLMKHSGMTVAGIGESSVLNNAEEAVYISLKNPLTSTDFTEASRVEQLVTEIMKNGAQVLWGTKIDPELDGKVKVTLIMTGKPSSQLRSNFGSIAPQLFNLEPYSEPEKKLPVDLGLYQLENFE